MAWIIKTGITQSRLRAGSWSTNRWTQDDDIDALLEDEDVLDDSDTDSNAKQG